MDYDRALYRVYERVLEDLSSSAPINEEIGSSRARRQESLTSDSSILGSRFELNSNDSDVNININVDEISDATETGDAANSTDSNNATTTMFASESNVRNRGTDSCTVPFILPLFMSPYSDALMEALSNGSWRRFWDTVRYYHINNDTYTALHSNRDENTITNGRISATLRWINSFRGSAVGSDDSFSRLHPRGDQVMVRNLANHDEFRDSNVPDRLTSFDSTADVGLDEVEDSIEMTTINSSSGLRRRPAMRAAATSTNSPSEAGDRDPQRSVVTSSSSSSSSNSTTSNEPTLTAPSYSSSSDSSTDPITTPTTIMAQQFAVNNAARQRPRNSSDFNDTEHGNQIREGCTQKGLFNFMRVTMVIGICHLIILFMLHTTYVGAAISKTSISMPDNSSTSYHEISQEDEDYAVKSATMISRTCLEYALASRPPERRSHYVQAKEDEDLNVEKTNTESSNYGDDNVQKDHKKEQINATQNTQEPPLLSENEILQIIIYRGVCTGRCSRVHEIQRYSIANRTNETEKDISGRTSLNKDLNSFKNEMDDKTMSYPKFWDKIDFKYSSNEALMYLEDDMLRWHNVSLVNVTLTERCLNTGSDNNPYSSLKARFAQFFSNIYGMDVIIINQLMYGIKSVDGKFRNGYVQNISTKERWSWSRKLMETEKNASSDVFLWLSNKISVAVASTLAFFLITSVTAVTVRVLTSSGVVLMFPIFALLRRFGLNGADDRILGFSYPWIGLARRAIHRQRLHPQSHFIFAHLAKLFLFYIMYEACQSTWSLVLYRRSIPANLPLWLFGYAMVWEYFSMIFVRSALSAYFFPRITLLYFVCYHVYFYSVPYGFFDIALIPWFLFMLHAMCFTVISLEVPGSARGVVSLECPREVYCRLSWPEWSAHLPNEWSLFLPLNSRYIPLHDRQLGEDSDDEIEDDEAENDAEDGIVFESQDVNREEATNVGESVVLPLGNSDDITERESLHRLT